MNTTFCDRRNHKKSGAQGQDRRSDRVDQALDCQAGFSRQSDEENRLYTEPRCIEGNQGLPGLLHGRRVEDLAFAQGRGPDPATMDNTADFASTAVLEDPLQQ